MKRHLVISTAVLALALPGVAMANDAKPTISEAAVLRQLDAASAPTATATDQADEEEGAVITGEKRMALWDPSARRAQPTTVRQPSYAGSVRANPTRRSAPSYAARPTTRAAASLDDMRVSFASGSADLTPNDRANLGVFARALKMPKYAAQDFFVEGHTDSDGSRALNLDLSQRRAQAVVNYLTGQGVSAHLTAKGYGPDRPRSASNKALNRRVEIVAGK